jgi:DNA-binding LytR/AlgR family response regulator
MSSAPTALIADDEPRLAQDLASRLSAAWPTLQILAIVHDGISAASAIAEHQPQYAFLDIRMPGLDGVQVARLAPNTRVVFVTAYEEYAVRAFEAAAADYLLKPVSDERLAQCVTRLARQQTRVLDAASLHTLLSLPTPIKSLEWLTVRLADTTRLVAVNEVLYFRAGDKYTEAVTVSEQHLVRLPLKELIEQLNPKQFVQIHRSIVVNLRAIERIEHDALGRTRVHLRDRKEQLSVSRSYAAQFRQM